jgi:CelD/BcsL family acetyltransferase involved in cellulose biosynthesis
MSAERYQRERVRFRYQLGEVQLAARHVEIAVDTSVFLERPVDGGAHVPPADVLGSGVPCVMVLSQPVAAPLPLVTTFGGCIRFAPHQYKRSTILLEGTFEDYMKRMPPDRRRQLQKKQRKFKEACGGELRVRVATTRDELERFHREALPLAAKTYQERLFAKGLPKGEGFLADLRARAAEGRARGYLLDGPSGEPMAYLYAQRDGQLVYYDYCGYDDAHAKLSPGVVLQLAVLEDLFASHPGHIFDFGEGETRHKETFGTEAMHCADLYFFPKTARGLELFLGQAAMHGISRGAVAVLAKLGVKEKVKRLLRRGI